MAELWSARKGIYDFYLLDVYSHLTFVQLLITLIFYLFFQHWVRLEMLPEILIQSLKMRVDSVDSSYMPSLVVVKGGSSFTSMHALATVHIHAADTIVTLLSDVREVNIQLFYF